MQPSFPPYQLLYLDGRNKPPVLTSGEVLRALRLSIEGFRSWSRAERVQREARHLYKFRSLDVSSPGSMEVARGLLVREEVWFSNASSFNDAMELDFDLEPPADRSLVAKAARQHRQFLDSMEKTPAERLRSRRIAASRDPRIALHSEAALRKDLDEGLGLCCLSADPRNELLWAHYGQSSAGFCVQLSTAEDPIFFLANEVIYTEKRPAARFFAEPDQRDQVHLYKTPRWAYEREWRLAFVGVRGAVRLERNTVSAVILGSRASIETVNAVISLLKERADRGLAPLRIYRAEISRRARKFCILRYRL